MEAIDHGRFQRMLTRSAEVAAEAGMGASVARAYFIALQPAAEAYEAAHRAVVEAEAAFRKKHRTALDGLASLDGSYRDARKITLAFAPCAALPECLASQPTDLDRLDAIERLLDVLDSHGGEAWADHLAASAFGQWAAAVVSDVNEAMDSDAALSAARDARAMAYGLAHERCLRFKRAVRDALGAGSRQYKRLHLRASASSDDTGPATVPEPAVQRAPRREPTVPISERHRSAPLGRGGEDWAL